MTSCPFSMSKCFPSCDKRCLGDPIPHKTRDEVKEVFFKKRTKRGMSAYSSHFKSEVKRVATPKRERKAEPEPYALSASEMEILERLESTGEDRELVRGLFINHEKEGV